MKKGMPKPCLCSQCRAWRECPCQRPRAGGRWTMMSKSAFTVLFRGVLATLGLVTAVRAQQPGLPPPPEPLYKTGPASKDGIGKFYYGREIAAFMTHEGAAWLERPEREAEEKPELLLKALQ